MKIRNGFVSNSSSSSFVIDKTKLNALQILAIRDHINIGRQLGMKYARDEDAWDVTEKDFTINLYTFMDNFSMSEFLEKISASHAIQDGE